jgi:ATP-dependent DNA helicase RecG
LNAIVHRDYSTGIPIQIKVFPNEVIIYNDGGLPEAWTLDDLLGQHRSRPRNPGIANAFFRSGQIETWGRGIEKIEEACRAEGQPPPVFKAKPHEISVSFPIPINATSTPPGGGVGVESGLPTSSASRRQAGRDVGKFEQQILGAVQSSPASRRQLLDAAGLTDAYWNYQRHILPLVEAGLLALTRPDTPRSPAQRYAITDAGRVALDRLTAGGDE